MREKIKNLIQKLKNSKKITFSLPKFKRLSALLVILILIIITLLASYLINKNSKHSDIKKPEQSQNNTSDPKNNFSEKRDYFIYDNTVYYRQRAENSQAMIVQEADPNSFQTINDENNLSIYAKDKNNVYFEGEKIEGADPESFNTIDSFYAKDKNNVYRNNGDKMKKIPGVDPTSFEILENVYGYQYIKDLNKVYYVGYYYNNIPEAQELVGADPASFEVIHTPLLNPEYPEEFFRDKDNVYFNGIKLDGLNPDKLQISYVVIKDDKTVYLYGGADSTRFLCKAEGADAASFHTTKDGFFVDKNNTYEMNFQDANIKNKCVKK